MGDIAVPLVCGEAGLRESLPPPAEDAPDGQPQGLGQVVCLVEPALESSQRVKRHRHDGIGAGEQVGRRRRNQPGQRGRENATVLVFQGVDEVAQRALIAAGAARSREAPWRQAATPAERRPIVSERIAAAHAQRRRDGQDAAPAGAARWAVERAFQRRATPGASGRQEYPNQGIADGEQHDRPALQGFRQEGRRLRFMGGPGQANGNAISAKRLRGDFHPLGIAP